MQEIGYDEPRPNDRRDGPDLRQKLKSVHEVATLLEENVAQLYQRLGHLLSPEEMIKGIASNVPTQSPLSETNQVIVELENRLRNSIQEIKYLLNRLEA